MLRTPRGANGASVLGSWLLGQAFQRAWDKPALGTGPSTCLGHARSWDRPFNTLGTCSLVGQALQHEKGSCCSLVGQALPHAWDMPALGTGPSRRLGQARSWDRPFNMLGTSPLLGQALQHAWDKPAFGTGPATCLGHARSWERAMIA